MVQYDTEFTLHVGDHKSSIHEYQGDTLQKCVEGMSLVCVDFGLVSVQRAQDPNASLSEILHRMIGDVPYMLVSGGEQGKTKASFELLLDACMTRKLTRKDRIAVIGGGALCDVVAFVASLYMRGIEVVLIPSTLLSIVDASIGGKTAINYRYWKNMVGSFYPAQEIVIVPHLLSTLSSRLLREGLAEIVKAGMLRDERILDILEAHGELMCKEGYEAHTDEWRELIFRAIAVKVGVVQEDFKEQNVRAFLNLGHTFAHAHEACAKREKKELSHGDAVGLGIRAALMLGAHITKASSDEPYTHPHYATRIKSLLDTLDYPKSYEGYSVSSLLHAMSIDKKRVDNEMRFVMQSRLMHTELLPINKEKVSKVLHELGAHQ